MIPRGRVTLSPRGHFQFGPQFRTLVLVPSQWVSEARTRTTRYYNHMNMVMLNIRTTKGRVSIRYKGPNTGMDFSVIDHLSLIKNSPGKYPSLSVIRCASMHGSTIYLYIVWHVKCKSVNCNCDVRQIPRKDHFLLYRKTPWWHSFPTCFYNFWDNK